ncbi:hypothetical protein IT409_02155, partial [Candidatus Falkowbacteria bacterium]|nr:hypothetical protein [Candidatus Falkowbacteria bacterium]
MQLSTTEISERQDFIQQYFGTTKGFVRKGKQPPPIETIQEKITMLTMLGFVDPCKIIRKYPGVLDYSQERIGNRIDELRMIGFLRPHRLITRYPKILDLSKSLIELKLLNLTMLGFHNPRLMVVRY